MVNVENRVSKRQYGNYVFYENDSPSLRYEIKQLLEENMKDECQKHNIDLSKVHVDYIFKPVGEMTKLEHGFKTDQDIWTAAWKVTLWS